MESETEPVLAEREQRVVKATFTPNGHNISPIKGGRDLFIALAIESKKLWNLAGPAIFTFICQYSLSVVTQIFAGHISTLDLAAFSVQNSVLDLFSWGIMEGMGCALETLCGQEFGAGQLEMLGVYMQRSWIVLNFTALPLTLLYVFSGPLLKLIGQTEEISDAASRFAVRVIPLLFAYAMNFPIAGFLQSQSKMMVMTAIAAVALLLHTFFCWLLMLKLGWGLTGAAVVLNASWWFIVIAQLVYIFSGACGPAWCGFSWKAFQNLWSFFKLSAASALMTCLEMWYFMVLILFAGYMKNAEVSVDAMSICMSLLTWTMMVASGMNAAISVRVSNELGAARPRTAILSLVSALISSLFIGIVLSMILIIFRDKYLVIFSNDTQVRDLADEVTPLLAFSIVINNVQTVLSGVVIGAGWQAIVSHVNIACYYLFGVPLGCILGYKFNMGVKGIWLGMLAGTFLQTCVLLVMIYKTNWKKEASVVAEEMLRRWGGNEIRMENSDAQLELKVLNEDKY